MSLLIPRETLDEIASRLDIVSLVSDYVQLKKSGKDYKGLCPFHQEKTPSFMVSPSKQIFHCFGCGQGGNLYGFVMKMESLSFPEVVQKMASRAGVEIARIEREGGVAKEKKEIYFKINRYAAWFFADQLKKGNGAEAARYVQKRGIKPETVDQFQLGYAPAQWDGLALFLQEKKVPQNEAEALGLIRKRREGGTYDFFRNRLMFPIIDYEGRVIGFSGRRLNDGGAVTEAKYVNSSESPIYQKSLSVYGLAQAKSTLREEGEAILVEGQLDVIRLHQSGIRNALAPLGTALTVSQIRLIQRFAKNLVVMFDGDEAGRRALLRSLNLLFGAGVHPRVVALPSGEDPDTYVAKKGGEVFKKEVAASLAAMEWMMLDVLGHSGSQPSRRIEAAKQVLPYIQELPLELERKSYLARLAQFLGLGEEALTDLTKKQGESATPRPAVVTVAKNSLERILLGLYVRFPQQTRGFIDESTFLQFQDESLKSLALALLEQQKATGNLAPERLMGPDNCHDENLVSELAFEFEPETATEEDVKHLLDDCLRQWKKQRAKSLLLVLTGEIQLAEIANDAEALKNLLARKNEAIKNLKELTG